MRYILTLFSVVVCSCAAFAQSRIFYGRVVDNNNAGVPFAVVEAKGRNEGVYCNEQGVFAFRGNADSVKTLGIYCMGYERKEIATEILPLDSIIIQLKPKIASLKEVVIKPHNDKERILGKSPKSLTYTGDCYRFYGSETAILLKTEPKQEGILKDVYVFITNDGDYTTKFRVHVYAWDSGAMLPGQEITDSNVIAAAKSGNTWVKVGLANKNIPLGKGLFVSIEWVSGFGNNTRKLQSGINPEVNSYNGQVLGLTSDYSRSSMTYSRKPFHKDWEYYDPADAQRKMGRFLNPMIYCTYTSVK